MRVAKKVAKKVVKRSRTKTAKSKKDLLFDDRDETGVKFRKTTVSGYFDDEDDDGAYTTGLYSKVDSRRLRLRSTISFVELVERTRRIIQGVVIVMTPTGAKRRPSISWDAKTSYTDGKNIWISHVPLQDKSLIPLKRIDIAAGLGIHEMCHIRYTDFEYSHMIVSSRKPHKLVKYLENTLEDERIERLCTDEFPGYANLLVPPKVYFFDKVAEATEPKDLIHIVIRELFNAVRFPERSDVDNLVNIEKEKPGLWENIIKVIQPYPTTTKAVWKAAFDIYELLKTTFSQDEVDSSTANEDADTMSEIGGDAGSPVSSGDGDQREKAEMLAALLEAIAAGSELQELREHENGTLVLLEFPDDITGKDCKVSYHKVTQGSVPTYKAIVNKIRPQKATLARLLQTETVNIKQINRGMLTGTLDTAKLAEAKQRVETVYLRRSESRTTKHSVVIVIDQSYSMSGALKGSSSITKIEAAKETAILLHEAIIGQPDLNLFMYGHTADHENAAPTNIYVYHEPGFDKKGVNLSQVSLKSNNRDGTALQAILKRVRQHTSEHTIVLYIADGAPYATNYSGPSANKHLKQVVDKAEKDNFTVVGISIDSHFEPKTMFNHYVEYSGTKSIPKQLSEVILKQVRKHRKIIVS
jgi:Mg-chelatase subunit ChlD